MFETHKFGNKIISGRIGLNIKIHASPFCHRTEPDLFLFSIFGNEPYPCS